MNRPDSEEKNAETTPSAPPAYEAEQTSVPPEMSAYSVAEALKLEIEKYKDMSLRCQAELENYRKRIVREKEDTIRYANSSLLERLLPILDSFELGLEAAKNTSDASSILQGMSMVHKQFNDFLKEFGVQVIDAEGCPFDPNLHDAVSHEHSDKVESGHIICQTRRGYKLKDRLLRPSSVVVSKGKQIS